jgi:MFS family permease
VKSELNILENLKYNFVVNVIDGSCFGLGIGFASFTTILPLFVSQLTNSAILIGLIPAIHSMFWQIPQLFMARTVESLRQIKPHVILMTINERLPYLGLAFVAFYLPQIGVSVGLVLIFSLLIWQGIGAGLTANGWQSMIAKVIPSKTRGRFFGVQSAAANLFASIGALAAGIILQKIAPNIGFSICFFITFIFMLLSMLFLGLTREPVVEKFHSPEPLDSLSKSVLGILKTDRAFIGFLITRMIFQFGMMSFAFYIVYGSKYLGMSNSYAGVVTSILLITQVVSNPILGWVADKWGHLLVLIFGAFASMLSALTAWLAPTLFWIPLVMVLAGLANTTYWTIGIAYTLEFGTDETRPTYVGVLNTLGAPAAILAPIFGGWLADAYSYSVTFFVSAGLSLLTALIMIIMFRNYSNHNLEKIYK